MEIMQSSNFNFLTNMQIKSFFDKDTATATHVITDPTTKNCAIIDSVLDYDVSSGHTSTKSADLVIDFIKNNNLKLEWILETHIHADHLTASNYLKQKLGGKTAIGDGIVEVLKFWTKVFNNEDDTPLDGSQFDYLFHDGEKFKIGNLEVEVIHTPGHTPACVCYLIEDAIFVGDTIFMPYVGTARTDFPGGSAKILYNSIQKIYALPDSTRIFIGHDYPLDGNEPAFETTIAEEKNKNILVSEKVDEISYVDIRNKRDFNKPVPKLLLPAIQVNLRGGTFGKVESNGTQYIKIPVNKI